MFEDYFNRLDMETVRDNFILIYELLDEMCDFGWPQFTDAKILKEFFKNIILFFFFSSLSLSLSLSLFLFPSALNLFFFGTWLTPSFFVGKVFFFLNQKKSFICVQDFYTARIRTVPVAVTNAVSWRVEGQIKKIFSFVVVKNLFSLVAKNRNSREK